MYEQHSSTKDTNVKLKQHVKGGEGRMRAKKQDESKGTETRATNLGRSVNNERKKRKLESVLAVAGMFRLERKKGSDGRVR